MRIAYVAPYQGPTLLARRPVVRNRSMSNRVKIELIASLLRSGSHDVEIISQGEVVDTSWTFYPAFVEEERFHPDIPIFYGSVLPVRRVNGFWSNAQTLRVLKERHRAQPYDLVIIFNLKGPQLACANYAIQRLHLPVILEYEDDRFVNVKGKTDTDMGGLAMRFEMRTSARLLKEVSGCVAVSPHLMSQLPAGIPTLLLRGVAGDDIVTASRQSRDGKKNIVLFSGTHIESNGVAPLIQAWPQVGMPGWELHITGYGQLTDSLRAMASGMEGVFFHGLVSREQLVSLMSAARVCVNPHQVSQTPGNVFAFKIIEYLAAGAHVVTTPMGALEKPLEAGITYMPANSPETIAATLRTVIREERYQHTASKAAHETYGPTAVSNALNTLLGQVGARR
jgi:glycosyltransferase involved in cell wall biosynthesis